MSSGPGLLARALRVLGHMEWLPFGVRERAIRAFFPPEHVRPQAFETTLRGKRYAGDLASYIDWTVYFYGCYEPEVADVLTRLAKGRRCVWDIGANCGHHALLMGAEAGAVHAFEPWPPVREQLERNAALNPASKIVVHGFGLADVNEQRTFNATMGANRGIGTFEGGYTGEPEKNTGKAPAGSLPLRRGDDVLAEGLAPPPDLIKIDVEGYEPLVLKGLANTLAKHRPIVALEYPERGVALYPNGGSPLALMPENYLFYAIVVRDGRGELVAARPEEMLGREIVLVPQELKSAVS